MAGEAADSALAAAKARSSARTRLQRAGVVLVLSAGSPGCATGGRGTTPPLPGQASGDDAVAQDDDATLSGDDGAAGDDAGPGSSDDGAAAGTCNDPISAVKALFVLTPVPCTSGADCPSGGCCYVGPSSSTCVMP